jgi:glycosyltransferase involved in cell wall biosynthesis
MFASKVKNILVEHRLPWSIQTRLDIARNRYYYYRNRWMHRNKYLNSAKKTIGFKCGFHGKSGAVFSISDIANLLAHQGFHVEFVSYPESHYNSLLEQAVKIINTPNMGADLFICDVSCDHEFLESVKTLNKKCIVSCHGLLYSLHGLDPEYVQTSLQLAHKVRFVNTVQQDSFQLQAGHYTIIPNMTKPIKKIQRSNNVGVVGNLGDEHKNVKESVTIALQSKVDYIHLWGVDQKTSYQYNHPRIKTHPWEGNKEKIYNSFDVLVFMSKQETFGRVVIESMSAGIPCLLSAIPAFEQFRTCPGVAIIDSSNRGKASQILNELLAHKDNLRESIINFWKVHYSEQAIAERWIQFISECTKK